MLGNKDSEAKNNVSVRVRSGYKCFGSYNTFIGSEAGYRYTTGSRNVNIGSNTYGACKGNDNTVVGFGANHTDGVNGILAIGNRTVSNKSNQIVIGTKNSDEVVIAGKIIHFNDDGTVTWEAAE